MIQLKTFTGEFPRGQPQLLPDNAAVRAVDCDFTNGAQASVTHALDVVGTIYKPTGAFVEDEEGMRSAVMAPLDGFHVNLAIDELPEALIPFSVIPDHPTRVFA